MTKQEFMAMSLPYGIKTQTIYDSSVWNVNGFSRENGVWLESYEDGDKLYDFCEVEPILRPLSDLTKEIEHKGEKFVSMTKIMGMEDYKHFFEKWSGLKRPEDWSVIDCWWVNTEFDKKRKPYEHFSTWHLDRISLSDAMKLIEWHFDIAGLIEKGEAIDVNKLETNPYERAD